MRAFRVLVTATLMAGLSLIVWCMPAMARTAKGSPQIMSITATRTNSSLDIVVRTTAVPATYRVCEHIYFYDSAYVLVGQDAGSFPRCSGAGTGTSTAQPNSEMIALGAQSVRIEAVLSQTQRRHPMVVVDTVDKAPPVTIPVLPSGWVSMPLTIWAR
jgi:hypothetical protein